MRTLPSPSLLLRSFCAGWLIALLICLSLPGTATAQGWGNTKNKAKTSGAIDLDAEINTGGKDNKQFGSVDVDLKDKKKKKVDPYAEAQDSVIAYYENLNKSLSALSSGKKVSFPAMTQPQLMHLNGLYLFCSIENGTCPDILDSVLEIDIINSKQSGKASCPLMLSFWKNWIGRKFEKQHRHKVKIGYMKETENFKRNTLPKYLKCSTTVKEELAKGDGLSNAEFFAARYGENGLAKVPVKGTLDKLIALKDSVPNVFQAVE